MILALFNAEAGLARALERFRAERIGPLRNLHAGAAARGASNVANPADHPGRRPDQAPRRVSALQAWSYTVAYPFPIGGRPQFAWASFIPTVFENGVLVAIVAGSLPSW